MLDIRFETSRFSGIGSHSGSGSPATNLLTWLSEQLKTHGVHTTNIHPVDDNAEMDASLGAANYVVSAERLPHSDDTVTLGQWRLVVQKRRSVVERALGTNKMSNTDPILWMIESALHAESDIRNVRREPSAA